MAGRIRPRARSGLSIAVMTLVVVTGAWDATPLAVTAIEPPSQATEETARLVDGLPSSVAVEPAPTWEP